jgi:hypothetical protein
MSVVRCLWSVVKQIYGYLSAGKKNRVSLDSAELTPCMKLSRIGTANRRISNKKYRMMKCGCRFAQSFSKIIMIEYLTSTLVRRRRIRYSLFDIRYLSASGGFAFSEFLSRFDWTLAASGDAHMKLQMFGTVGRATVPAETGRHGGRPYDSTRPKSLFRLDWPLFRSVAGLIHLAEHLTPET